MTDCQSMAEVPSSVNHSMPPAGSTAPGSTPLNDQEVEEIIRFINGVDSTVTSSPLAGNAATKQKTKQKCRKVSRLHCCSKHFASIYLNYYTNTFIIIWANFAEPFVWTFPKKSYYMACCFTRTTCQQTLSLKDF